MRTPQITDRACPLLGKRGAFEGVARRPWTAGEMGTDDARTPTTHRTHHNPQRWVEKIDRSIKGSGTPHQSLTPEPLPNWTADQDLLEWLDHVCE